MPYSAGFGYAGAHREDGNFHSANYMPYFTIDCSLILNDLHR
jgi:hypothetical protein